MRPSLMALAVAALMGCPSTGGAATPAAGDAPGHVLQRLAESLERTHHYLLRNKRGMPYAEDPRTIGPVSESLRLQACAQALGYLNLYRLTGARPYLREAEERLDHLLENRALAQSGMGLEGQVGYAFLLAHEITGDPRYREAGLEFGERCLRHPENYLNWGYLSALNLGKAHVLSGDQRFRDAARLVTLRTAHLQLPNGAFPHQYRGQPANAHYTAWLALEMLLHRADDPDDPDMELGILRAARFLERRVNADGSLNYEDSAGTYHDDLGITDTRGWLNELPMVACVLRATGRHAEAERVLDFMLRQEQSGPGRGGYPDKWDYTDPANPLTLGNPSVVRTSLVFWLASQVLLIDPECSREPRPCAIAPGDCQAAFREAGLCEAGLQGLDYCIAGTWTGCMDEALVSYRVTECGHTMLECLYFPEDDYSWGWRCTLQGDTRCVGAGCTSTCLDPRPVLESCRLERQRGNWCGTGPAAGAVPPPGARGSEVAAPAFAGVTGTAPGSPAENTVVEVYDVAGRRLAHAQLTEWPAAPQREVRRLVPGGAGVYFVRLASARRVERRPIVLLR